jgi:hypothetical protein
MQDSDPRDSSGLRLGHGCGSRRTANRAQRCQQESGGEDDERDAARDSDEPGDRPADIDRAAVLRREPFTRASHEASVPPSTARTWPVTMLDASDAR